MTTETLRPNEAGDVTDLRPKTAPNYSQVNEAVADGDTSYVDMNYAVSQTLYDLYNLPDTAIPADSTINSVTIYWTAKKVAVPTTRSAVGYSMLKTESTEYTGDLTTLTTAYVERNTAYATNPNTGLAWTITELNNMQIGVKMSEGFIDEAHFAYGVCTQVYVVIDYTVSEPEPPPPEPEPSPSGHRIYPRTQQKQIELLKLVRAFLKEENEALKN